MADSADKSTRALNPLVLHLQKLVLELKCPLCLNLFSRPLLLPCDHIFCNSCIPRSTQCCSDCPMCKSRCTDADLRPLAFLENVITIYKGLDALSGAKLFQSVSSVAGRPQEDNSSSGQSVSANKLAQVLFNCSVGGGKVKGFEMPGRGENQCNGDQNADMTQLRFKMQDGHLQECKAVQIDINQLEQSSPCSLPSFGDIKGSDNESSDQGSEHSLESYQIKRSVKRSFNDRTRQEHGFSASETEVPLRDSRRLKRLDYGTEYVSMKRYIQSTVLQSESLVASNSELEIKPGVPLASETLPPISDGCHANKYICGFCQSSNVSEVTGSMLHYANHGNPVVGEEAARSNVIHVHSRCIDWAPQVYYEGDTVKNLKEELARGSKLKCSKCGLKGAALGCYMKSCRRSYHFPCAAEIPKCRWDYESFLVLCPAHSVVKFPNEKSGKYRKNNHTVPSQITQQPNFWASSSNKANKWVLCGSALSSEEKLLLVRFGSMIGVTVSKFWRPNVTHVIASTDAKGSCTRTLKVLMAILNGSWVLKIDWIKDCMKAMHPVDEEPYEVSLDNHGREDGPKTGRLRALNKGPKLFDGLSFYFCGDFMPGYKEDLQSLIVTAGGNIWKSEEELLAQYCDDKAAPSKILIVYNLDSPVGSQLGEEVSTIWKRLNEAEELATKIGAQVIGHTWLLESIAAHKLQPFVS